MIHMEVCVPISGYYVASGQVQKKNPAQGQRKKALVPLKLKSLSLTASREEGAAVLDYSQSQQQQAPHTGKSPEKSFVLPQLVLIG